MWCLKVILKVQKYEYETGNYYYKASWSLDQTNLGSGYVNGETVKIPWTKHDGSAQNINVKIDVTARQITTRSAQNFNPFDVLADLNIY